MPIGCTINNCIFEIALCYKCSSAPYNSYWCRINRKRDGAELIFNDKINM